MFEDQQTLFGRPIDRRSLLSLTGKVLAGGTVAGMWLSPELAHYVEAAARGQAAGGTITVMNQYTPPGKGKWQKYFDIFTKETGIKLVLDDQIYNNQYQKITTQGQAGVASDDVVAIDTIWTGSFGGAGFTFDLTDFLAPAVKNRIIGSSLHSVSYKGRLYGLPEYNSSKHFFYNKRMFDKVGLTRAPLTLDEMFSYCAILAKNKGKLGIEYPMSWSWKQAEGLTCDYVQMVDSLGAPFFAADGVTPQFNKGGGVQALQLMKMMLDKGYAASGSLNHTENDVQNDFLSGKIAMCTNWEGQMTNSNDPTQTAKAVLGQVRMALIPGSGRHRSGSCLGPEGWAIMKTSKNQAAAKAFVNWQCTTAAQKEQMVRFDYLPIFSDMYDDPTLRTLTKKADGQDDYAVYGEQFKYAQARPNFNGYVEASHKLQVQLQKAFLGQESAQKAMDTAAQQMGSASGGGNNP